MFLMWTLAANDWQWIKQRIKPFVIKITIAQKINFHFQNANPF